MKSMRRFLAPVSALVLSLCIPAELALADSNTGWIYGRVLIAGTRQPVCPITIIATNDRESPWEAQTRSDGSFYFLSLLPGRVRVIIGRSRLIRDVEVHANLPTEETFYIAPLRGRSYARRDANVQRLCGSNSYGGYMYSDYDINRDWLTQP